MDLERLGEVMRERREALGMSRAELARRLRVNSSYLWLLETAKPRASGEPSRPSQELLEKWAEELDLNERGFDYVFGLAGYETMEDIHREFEFRDAELPEGVTSEVLSSGPRGELTRGLMRDIRKHPSRFPQPRPIIAAGLNTDFRVMLEDARQVDEDTWNDVVNAAQSMIDWLRYRVQQAEH